MESGKVAQHPQRDSSTSGLKLAHLRNCYTKTSESKVALRQDRSGADVTQRPPWDSSTGGTEKAPRHQRSTNRSGMEGAQHRHHSTSTSGAEVAQRHQRYTSTSGAEVAQRRQHSTSTSGAEVAQRRQHSTSTSGAEVSQRRQHSTSTSGAEVAQRRQCYTCTSGAEVAQHRQLYTNRSGVEVAQRHQHSISTSGAEVAQRRQRSTSTSGVEVVQRPQLDTSISGSEVSQHPQLDTSASGSEVSQRPQLDTSASESELSQCPQLDTSASGSEVSQRPQLDTSTRGADAVSEAMQKLLDSNTMLQNEVKLLDQILCEARIYRDETEQTIAQLDAEKAELKAKVETLTVTVKETQDLLVHSNMKKDNLMNECEKERRAHSVLRSEYKDLKKTLMEIEELIRVSVAESDLKHQSAEQTIAKLQTENSELNKYMEIQKDMVQELGTTLAETLQDYEDLKGSLAKSDLIHKKSKQVIALLETEKSALSVEVQRLRNTLQENENLLDQALTECVELKNTFMIKPAETEQKIQENAAEIEASLTLDDDTLSETHQECDQLTNQHTIPLSSTESDDPEEELLLTITMLSV